MEFAARLQALIESSTRLRRLAHLPVPPHGNIEWLHQPSQRKSPLKRTPRILLTAGVHGDEPAGSWALLEEIEQQTLDPRLDWYLLPWLNPSGFAEGKRNNQQDIDLNRDFKTRRSREIQFFIEATTQAPPFDLHLSLHEDWEYPQAYLYEINTGPRPSIAPSLLKALQQTVGLLDQPIIDGHQAHAPGWIVHDPQPDEPEGWPEAIYLVHRQALLSYTIETPSKLPLPCRVSCHRAVIQTVSRELLREPIMLNP